MNEKQKVEHACTSAPPAARRLVRHLVRLLLLKVILLALLWSVFIRPYRISVDAPAMESRFGAAASPSIPGEHRS